MIPMTKLRELRLKMGLSQMKLAILAGINVTTIYMIEVGKSSPRGTTKQKLAKALGVDTTELG